MKLCGDIDMVRLVECCCQAIHPRCAGMSIDFLRSELCGQMLNKISSTEIDDKDNVLTQI